MCCTYADAILDKKKGFATKSKLSTKATRLCGAVPRKRQDMAQCHKSQKVLHHVLRHHEWCMLAMSFKTNHIILSIM
jgi:hypothetical protein